MIGDVERKVKALLERANHPGTPRPEAESALALAYRLMQKHELDVARLAATETQPRIDLVERERWEIRGPYRARRGLLFSTIAEALSCATYRDRSDDPDAVFVVVFGARADLDALGTLYTAAEMLAHRTIPYGDRGFRTSWWQGFTEGIRRKLERERRRVVRDARGVGLALRERRDRAEEALVADAPDLVTVHHRNLRWGAAYEDGRRRGGEFDSGYGDLLGGRIGIGRGG